MSWDDPYLSGRFTSDSYQMILDLLRADDPDTQMCALMELGETLSYGNDDLLSNFPLREMAVQMIKFLKDDRYEFLQESSSQCISKFLECHTSSTRTLIENGALEVVRDKLNSCQSMILLKNLVHACYIVSQYRPDDLGAVVGIQPLLNAINFLSSNLADQRSVAKTISNMTSRTYYNSFADSIDSLIALMSIGDPLIAQNCLDAAINIVSQAPLNIFTTGGNVAIKTLCNLLPTLHDNTQIQQIVRFLYRISANPEAGRVIIDSGFDFSVLIGSTIMEIVEYDEEEDVGHEEDNNGGEHEEEANQNQSSDRNSNDPNINDPPPQNETPVHKNLSPEVITMSFQTILNLLPPPTISGNGLWDTKRKPPSNSQQFAKRMQPILINVLLKSVEVNILAIVALSQTVKFDKGFKVSNELAHSLCGFTQQQNLLPYILYFVDSCPKQDNTQIFYKSGLMSLLCNKRLNSDHHLYKWYDNIIKKVTQGKASNIKLNTFNFKSFKSIWPLIEQLKTTSSYDLLQDGFFEYLNLLFDKFVESQKGSSPQKHSIYELQPLIEELTELLHFLPIPKVMDPFGNSIYDINNSRQSVFISLKNENETNPVQNQRNRRRRRHSYDDDDDNGNLSGDDDDGNNYDEEENVNEYDGPPRRPGLQRARYNPKNCVLFTEAFYNYEILHIPDRLILNNWGKSGRLGQMIQPPRDLSNVTFTELSMYHRIFKSETYRKCNFTLNGKQIYPYDPLFRVLEMNRNQVINSSSNRFSDVSQESYSKIEVIDSKNYDDSLSEKLSVLEVPTNLIDPQMKKVLDFMKYLKQTIFPLMSTTKQVSPTLSKSNSSTSFLNFRNHKFESRLIMNQNSPYLTITCNSPLVQIVANYPFLFSYEARFYVYKTTTLSFISSLKNTVKLKNVLHRQQGRFRAVRTNSGSNNNNNFNDHTTHIKVRIDRDNIFEDGCVLLRNLGHPFFLFDINFEREEGIGIGPTQEFFSLMGREFAKKKRNMWRNDHNGKDDDDESFAMSKIGLYPMAGASLPLFELLGKFCGKAVEMGFLVPIPLSRAFFRVFKDEEVKMEDIDEQLSKSILSATSDDLDGFTFTYPGTEFEMIKGGNKVEVSKKNVEKYKSLVQKFTVYKEAVDAFKSGFHSIVSPGLDNMFDADDLMRLISGDDTHATSNSLTKSDLRDNTIISHGYSKDSPQIDQLFEVIESFSRNEKSLFIKFVTGCERLPVGGLKNLSPRLTIARKVPEIHGQNADDLLPSVMTCTNYFKLPPYSTKEIMKAKILMAINEGQGAFFLT